MGTTVLDLSCMPCCGIDTCCCPDNAIPTTLTWDDGTNSGTLTWASGTTWTGTGDIAGCTGATIELECQSLGDVCLWDLFISTAGDQFGNTDAITCDPLLIVFGPHDTACGGGDFTVTITE